MSPDGLSAVYYGGESGRPRIWRVDLVTGSREAVTAARAGARHPVYDWEGDRIEYASDRLSPIPGETVDEVRSATIHTRQGVHLHIYLSRPDGSALRQLTDGPHRDHRPAFSPDGEWVAFASTRSGRTGIWRVRVDGGEPEPVFDQHWGFRPWYSADGRSIFFYGPDGDRHRIWLVDVETRESTRLLSDDQGITHGPFVSAAFPDQVLAHSTRDERSGLWTFPTSGAEDPACTTPESFEMAAHPTMARDGTIVFDVQPGWRTP